MGRLRSSLDQWEVLAEIVDAGGFARAAARLHRSQSAISYAVAQLQEALGVPLLQVQGRRAVLTPAGEQLLRRGRLALDQFRRLEELASAIHRGWETGLRLVVDAAYPRPVLLSILAGLRTSCPQTTISLADAVLSGAEEAITEGLADLVITTRVPRGFLGDWLMDVEMIAVAAAAHPLHALPQPLMLEDLAPHTQVVLRDSGQLHPRDEGWLGAQQRWTVSSLEASRALCLEGLAFAWLPAHLIAADIAAGRLKPLPLAAGAMRRMPLYAVLVNAAGAGPAARQALALFQRPEMAPAAPAAAE
ncbi:MAG TPA: LysR family transcriptional regulator [Steroidobacteraceae bacterium]|nr:LysR family transcriptional regulator [Steroidobacteraceae bacterium]